MNEPTAKPPTTSELKTEKKPGFIGRVLETLDRSLKQKADAKAQQSSCCGGDKGGKCC